MYLHDCGHSVVSSTLGYPASTAACHHTTDTQSPTSVTPTHSSTGGTAHTHANTPQRALVTHRVLFTRLPA